MNIIFYAAIFFTGIYLLQVIATFIGLDSTDGVDADFNGDVETGDHASFQMFTFRNMLGFLLGFFWGIRIGVIDMNLNYGLSILTGIILGILIILLQSSLFLLMKKLEQKNIPSLQSTIGEEGVVYLAIPKNKNGKVTVNVNGSQRTLYATSDEDISTGERVRVIDIKGETLVVFKV